MFLPPDAAVRRSFNILFEPCVVNQYGGEGKPAPAGQCYSSKSSVFSEMCDKVEFKEGGSVISVCDQTVSVPAATKKAFRSKDGHS